MLKENERIDNLEYKGLKIIQNKEMFCFGIDAVLLADFAKVIKDNSVVVDLGTGNGIIPILLSKKINAKKIIGVEIQPEVCEMANRSIVLNNLEDNVEILLGDIKTIEKEIVQEVNAVITNPPYKKENTGLINEKENKIIARHEVKCTLEDVVKTSSKLLKDKGSLFMIHRTERFSEIFEILRKYKLEPKRIRFVHTNKDTISNMVLIQANKNEGSFLKVEPPLIVYNNKTYTDEILKIYDKPILNL